MDYTSSRYINHPLNDIIIGTLISTTYVLEAPSNSPTAIMQVCVIKVDMSICILASSWEVWHFSFLFKLGRLKQQTCWFLSDILPHSENSLFYRFQNSWQRAYNTLFRSRLFGQERLRLVNRNNDKLENWESVVEFVI